MPIPLPDIPEADRTPLVQQLLEIILSIRTASGDPKIGSTSNKTTSSSSENGSTNSKTRSSASRASKPRPRIAPSPLEAPPRPPRDPQAKRPSSAERPKTAQLIITHEVVLPLADRPEGAVFTGYEDFVVPDLVLRPRAILYRRERWLTPDSRSLVAPLPTKVVPGCHCGPDLTCFILHRYHHQHVTQPLLLEKLRRAGIDISAGELNRLPTEGKDAFHREKDELLPAALAVWSYVEVDDTGAPHRGHTGACTQIGGELFAPLASTDSQSRLNFLEILRGPHTDYV